MDRVSSYRGTLQALRGRFLQAGAYSIGINLLMLVGPLYMLQIYDRVILSGSLPTLMGLFVIVVVLYLFMALYDMMRARVLSRAAYTMDQALAPAAFMRRLGADAGGQNTLRDVDFMRGFVAGPALRALFDAPWLPIFLVAVFLIHPMLGVLTLAGAVVVVALALLNHHATRASIAEAGTQDTQEQAFIEQCRRGTETVSALGMGPGLLRRWSALHGASLAHGQHGTERGDVFSSASRSFRLLLQAILLTGGAYLALRQEISMGMIVGVSILAGRALAPIDQIIGQWRVISRAWQTHLALSDVFEGPPEAAGMIELPEITGRLELSDVTKAAPDAATSGRAPILAGVSLALAPGDGLCVMGDSASGKSSLARMIVGAWSPDSGQVRIDGATLDQWDAATLGRSIGYLPQAVDLFPGTIAENIARFDPEARDADIVDAAQTAQVHEMILGLPEGYATRVGTGGITGGIASAMPLSGGQVQRIGLARALFGAPRLLVLDEPNANLDIHGEEALVDTVQALRAGGATVVMMTHRPSLIAAASKMLVMHKGRVAMFGDRAEIMEAVQGPSKEPSPSPSPSASLAPSQAPAVAQGTATPAAPTTSTIPDATPEEEAPAALPATAQAAQPLSRGKGRAKRPRFPRKLVSVQDAAPEAATPKPAQNAAQNAAQSAGQNAGQKAASKDARKAGQKTARKPKQNTTALPDTTAKRAS